MKTKKNEAFYEELLALLGPKQVRTDELLKKHTTFRIGGPADIFVTPKTMEELSQVMALVTEYDQEVTILGGGSNVLVLDTGIRGILLCLSALQEHIEAQELEHETCRLRVSAGRPLKAVSRFAYEQGLTGLEFAVGIPGTIGGAIYMNAGAYGGEMKQVVTKVRTVDSQGKIKEYDNEQCDFGYRHSAFQDNGEIIAEIELELPKGNKEEILQVMEDLTQKRVTKQPLEYPSAGSTFKRPTGYFAGTLIDQTGLKGLSVGDAQVSEKHAGFIVNRGNATAGDVLALIREVQRRIKEEHGVDLETEVRLMGEEK